jgi:hypothetical protein
LLNISYCIPGEKITILPTRKNAQGKILDKGNFCYYCESLVGRLFIHLERVHSEEIDVRRLLSIGDEIGRSAKLTEIRNRGNNKHNRKVLGDGVGQLHVARVPSDPGDCKASNFLPCHHCLLWVSKARLSRHKCQRGNRPTSFKISRGLVITAKAGVTSGMAKVLSELAQDEVGKVVLEDSLLMSVLKAETRSGMWHMKKWRDQMRKRLRIGARLSMEMRKTLPGTTLNEQIAAKHFDLIADSAENCAIGEDGRIHPETVLKIGHFVNLCIKRKFCDALRVGDRAVMEDMNNLADAKEKEWTSMVVKKARFQIQERNRNAAILLPTTEDVKKFAEGMTRKMCEAMSAFKRNKTQQNYRILQNVTLVKTIAFNRKRGGEVSSMTLTDYRTGIQSKDLHSEDIFASLSQEEKELAAHHHLVVVNGKCNRNVYILLNEEMKSALDLLVDNREIGCVSPENPFVFALAWSKDGFIKHSGPLKEFQEDIGVQNMSTRQMRKYLATTILVQYFLYLKLPVLSWQLKTGTSYLV